MSIMTSPVPPHGGKPRNAKRGRIAATVAKRLVMAFGIAAVSMLISRGTRSAAAATSASRAAAKTPAVAPGTPVISSIPTVVLVGGSFTVNGSGFTPGSVINFFVATSSGPVKDGPLTPNLPTSPTLLTVKVPATIPLGQGYASGLAVLHKPSFANAPQT
jgi:hypothetical protein